MNLFNPPLYFFVSFSFFFPSNCALLHLRLAAYQLLSATVYMHQKGICHRDLKLENVVYESKAADSDIFIIDYGLSKVSTGGAERDVRGSQGYRE